MRKPSILSQLFDESPKVAQSEIKFRLYIVRLELRGYTSSGTSHMHEAHWGLV
jgi:hypothetical protein